MRILFLCGSLEPGFDGVGDYTRRLAGELIREGHQAGIVALNDEHLKDELNSVQESTGILLPVLRLPSHWLPIQRFQRAGLWIDDFNPEWLSLQYVPFAFHAKGLPFGMSRLLLPLGKNRKWHIMFHELWVGMHRGAPAKEVVWGIIQRRIIISLIKKLHPRLVHTQSSLYKAQLAKLGVRAILLPLFSNIPVIENAAVYLNNKEEIHYKKERISFVLFGGVHGGAPVEQFAKEVKAYSNKSGIMVSLIILGRGGNEQKHWEQTWTKQQLEVIMLGEQSPEEISKTMRFASYGITTTVFGKVEKSGSVAAMTEHGLNVICVAAAWQPKSMQLLEEIPGVIEYTQGKLESFFHSAKVPSSFCKVEEVSKSLIASFTAVI